MKATIFSAATASALCIHLSLVVATSPATAQTKTGAKPTTGAKKKSPPSSRKSRTTATRMVYRRKTVVSPSPVVASKPLPNPLSPVSAPPTAALPAPAPIQPAVPLVLPATTAPVHADIPALPKQAQQGVFYGVGGGQIALDKAEFTSDDLPNVFGPQPPDAGTRYIVFTIRVKNTGTTPLEWTFDRFHPRLHTQTSGDKVIPAILLMTAKNNKFERQPIPPNEEKTLRFHFQIPQTAVPKSLTIGGEGEPSYEFALSGMQ